MKFERKHAVLLLAVAVWNVVTFGNFARNLLDAYQSGEDRATGYWVAHTVLIVGNFVIAGAARRPRRQGPARRILRIAARPFTLPGDSPYRTPADHVWRCGRHTPSPCSRPRRPPFPP